MSKSGRMSFDEFKWELGIVIGQDPITTVDINKLYRMYHQVESIPSTHYYDAVAYIKAMVSKWM